MKKGRHRRFQEARALKRQDLDSDSLSEIESLLDEEDVHEAGVVEDAGLAPAPSGQRADHGRSVDGGSEDEDSDDGDSGDGDSGDEGGDGDDWRKEVEQYLNDAPD